ncbi:hypothetical protein BHE97_01255 [Aeromicrobium sp. PE09-221]|uniref:LytR C-terminal domain-containing protein n=1 Tax=Aeromicrobium sp. PE09-221 TaxID=1898043 RepID=UPI000B3E4657|nr:LytR C-terminal domain-containing protein [Aeromicrobium sp. PE09-221]OUZ12380.1 hypothetical protein BHE97_01255 [Aeromicrobium sp. PE09-221]
MNRLQQSLVLVGTAVVFVGGAVLGTRLLLAPTGADSDDIATCETQTIAAGDLVQSSMVTVDIFNAGDTAGLANRVRINLEDRGFLGGRIGNSGSDVSPANVAILTENQDDPTVQLVARQFNGDVEFAEPDIDIEDAVTVILGSGYQDLRADAPTEIEAGQETSVCVPTIDLENPEG